MLIPHAKGLIGRAGLIITTVFALFLLLIPQGVQAKDKNAWDHNLLKVGVLEEPKTLNPWLASDIWSNNVLKLIYQPLYTHEPQNLDLIPWLAESMPVYDKANCTYLVKLKPCNWSDGSPFTAHDVVFTAQLIKKFKIPRFYSKWKFVTKIEALDDHTVRFTLKEPKAMFLSRTMTTPIMAKKQWQPVAEKALKTKKPLASLLQAEVKIPLGAGPFKLKEWREGVYIYLVNNEQFFGRGKKIAGRKLGPYIKGLLFKVYGISDAAILALRKGAVDMYWNGIQPGYLKEIEKDPSLEFFISKKSALYFFGFNLRKKPFSDLAFRKAIAYLIDKEFIIHRILQNYGMPLSSVIPPGNLFYYCPRGPVYGQGLSREERLKKACEILTKAGYSWNVCPVDGQGNIVEGSTLLNKDGTPIKEFTILTPPADYDPNRAMSGMMIQQWLRQAGLPVVARPMAFSALIQQVKWRHDFDCFVLGYGRLSLDPSYLRSFFHSSMDRKRGWNMSGFRDKQYDKLAIAANSAMDKKERRELVCLLQEILMIQVPYIPLYNPLLVEGVRTDHFKGWVSTTGGIGNIWSMCEVRPVD